MATLSGCGASIANPAFDLDANAAERDLDRIAADAKPLERPVFVAGGFADPGMATNAVTSRLERLFADEDARIVGVPFFSVRTFESSRERLVEAVEKRFPSDPSSGLTAEVDVVAISMGGLIARDAAMTPTRVRTERGPVTKRLNIRRLFTISTPHRGAQAAANALVIDPRIVGMAPGSDFLERLHRGWAERGYEVVAYVRLGDGIVGEANAVPPTGGVYWLPNLPLEPAHLQAHRDPRIIADIARRLRGESAWTAGTPTALPSAGESR
jgi:hypothetical protein